MIKLFSLLFLSFFLSATLSAQPMQKGLSTAKVLTDKSYNTEDADAGSPADMLTGDAVAAKMGTFRRISKHQDYGLTITRIVVDLGEGSEITKKELPEGSFEILGGDTSEKVIRNITGLSVTDNDGDIVESGRYATIDLDVGLDPDADNAYVYIVALNRELGKYTKGTKFIQQGRTLRK